MVPPAPLSAVPVERELNKSPAVEREPRGEHEVARGKKEKSPASSEATSTEHGPAAVQRCAEPPELQDGAAAAARGQPALELDCAAGVARAHAARLASPRLAAEQSTRTPPPLPPSARSGSAPSPPALGSPGRDAMRTSPPSPTEVVPTAS